ncbi:MAG: hypothetical protein AcusKO_01690 [Acuticoccus sp.]
MLGGCVANGGVQTSSSGQQVSAADAFMKPPPGGPAIIAVLEQRYQNGLAQDILLENNSRAPGQNVLYVKAYGPMGRDAGSGTLGNDIPSLGEIRNELRERFPGIPMQVSGLYAQNRYGPIGYATGRSRSGSNCLYVWQRIAPEPRLWRYETGAITWRLRLCDPNTSTRNLLLTAYGFTVTGSFRSPRWNPFGPPPEPDERIGKPGVTILPEAYVDPTVVAPVSFGGEPAPTRTARRSRPAAQPQVVNAPAPGAAVVPPPDSATAATPSASSPAPTAPRPSSTPTVLVPPSASSAVQSAPQPAPVSPPQVRVVGGGAN